MNHHNIASNMLTFEYAVRSLVGIDEGAGEVFELRSSGHLRKG